MLNRLGVLFPPLLAAMVWAELQLFTPLLTAE